MSAKTKAKRVWLAVLLAFVYPGLGHFYLRAWFRGFIWLGLALVTASMSIPDSVVTSFQTGGFDAMLAETRSLPFEALAPLFLIRVLNTVDAYLAAVQLRRRAREDGPACPACGRGLDAELDFCPWCTTRLEPEEEPEAAS